VNSYDDDDDDDDDDEKKRNNTGTVFTVQSHCGKFVLFI